MLKISLSLTKSLGVSSLFAVTKRENSRVLLREPLKRVNEFRLLLGSARQPLTCSFMDPVSGSACLLALVGLLAAIIFLQLLALLLLRCTSCLRGETTPRYSWTASRGHGDAQPVAAVVPYKRSLAEIRADRPKALPDQQEQGRLMAMLSWLRFPKRETPTAAVVATIEDGFSAASPRMRV